MRKEAIQDARILIIDNNPVSLRLLDQALRSAGYQHVEGGSNLPEVLPTLLRFRPDLILLDLDLPRASGIEFLTRLKTGFSDWTCLPILVLSADTDFELRRMALSLGARDFITKPFRMNEIMWRVRNLLESRFLYPHFDEMVKEQTARLEDAKTEMFHHLARACEYRDDDTGRHTLRVGQLSAFIADNLGMTAEQVELFRNAAKLHDIGKIGIPDWILLKPGKLNGEEFRVMKTHTVIGGTILSGSRFPVMQLAEQIALYHHERWDGTGYNGLSGHDIPFAGRLVAVADVFDVLTHDRPYKPAWPVDEALGYIRRQTGDHFDPEIVDAFLHGRSSSDLIGLAHSLGNPTAPGPCFNAPTSAAPQMLPLN